MKTETNNPNGWIFYDGRCAMCRREVDRWKRTFQKRGFEFVPQQTDWVQHRLGLKDGKTAEDMKVLTQSGRIRGGLDAVLYLGWLVWWARPMVLIARIPGIFHLLRIVYRQIAKRRYCFGGTCEIHDL